MRVYDFRGCLLQTGHILEITDDEAVCELPTTGSFRELYNNILPARYLQSHLLLHRSFLQNLHNLLQTELTAVNTQIILSHIQPLLIREKLKIRTTFLVHSLNKFPCTLFLTTNRFITVCTRSSNGA